MLSRLLVIATLVAIALTAPGDVAQAKPGSAVVVRTKGKRRIRKRAGPSSRRVKRLQLPRTSSPARFRRPVVRAVVARKNSAPASFVVRYRGKRLRRHLVSIHGDILVENVNPALMRRLVGAERGPVHVDVGGEGAYPAALNLNTQAVSSICNGGGCIIPNLVRYNGRVSPFATASVDLVTLENTPMTSAVTSEIERMVTDRGTIRLRHPADYAVENHRRLVDRFPTATVDATVIGTGEMLTVIHLGSQKAANDNR